jgi:hypothetical protein
MKWNNKTITEQKSSNLWIRVPPNLTLDMFSQTEQKFTNPWISVSCALTKPYLNMDMVSKTEQSSQPMN